MKPERGSMEALNFHKNITRTFCLQTNVTSSKSSVLCISFLVPVPSCKSIFSSCSKLFVYLDVVLNLVLICWFVYL